MSLILVTGGAGFIGSHVVRALLLAGHSVRVLDDLSTGKKENLPTGVLAKNLTLIVGDIRDENTVTQAVQNVDAVVHLAAQTSVPKSVEFPEDTFNTNVKGFENLLSALQKNNFLGRILYASSAAVYGEPKTQNPLTEADSQGAHLLSPYAKSKAENERQAQKYEKEGKISALGLRFFNVYGPRQDEKSPYSGVLSIFATRVAQGKPLTLHGNGNQCRDFLYITDLTTLMLTLLENRAITGILNISTGTPTTLNEVIALLENITQKTVTITRAPKRKGDIDYSCANITALQKALPTLPAFTSLKDGLRLYLKWLKN